ncbi:uncharacterized protein LOC132279742 [Cornus florida]|uniref:uncharacterized protein LOC132279742 n=1 Tax=Cornus florida TaxID=4283 RepID=UPI00289B83D3|nr:uncharacterized protein LOC132279742 [Cornus florida]
MDTSSVNHIEVPLETASGDPQCDDPQLQNDPLNHFGSVHCSSENADSRNGDAYINEDPSSCSQDSVIASKAFNLNRSELPKKNEVNLSKIEPLDASGRKLSNGQNSSQRQRGNKINGTPPTTSSTVSPSVRALESKRQSGQAQRSKSIHLGNDPPSHVKRRIPALKDSALSIKRSGAQKTPTAHQVWQKKTKAEPSACQSKLSSRHTAPTYDITSNGESKGQPGKGQQSKPNPPCKDPVKRSGNNNNPAIKDPVKRSGNNSNPALKDPSASIKSSGTQKTSATQQVWQEKTKAKSSRRRRSRRSSKHTDPVHVHHITWNGLDELCEPEGPVPLGLNCHICEDDLSYAPRDDEAEYYEGFEQNLPEVAVLLCGHAFHVKCLQFLTSDEGLSDPQCYLCSSC